MTLAEPIDRPIVDVPKDAAPVPFGRPHVLTVCLEDYYQAGAFRDLIETRQWERFESRLLRGTKATLALLDRHDTRATFFVLGWIAERWPDLVRDIAERGHEVACRGYDRTRLHETTAERLRDDLLRAREAIEAATRRRVLGHRSGSGWLRPSDSYVLDLVAELGFAYDSSLLPRSWSPADRRFTREIETEHGPLWEVPPSATRMLGFDLPVGSGNYLRQLPKWWSRSALAKWDRSREEPFVLYFHTWELDPEQPRLDAAGRLTRVRHYRNLDRVPALLDEFLGTYDFGPAAETLGLSIEEAPRLVDSGSRSTGGSSSKPSSRDAPRSTSRGADRTPISIVVPCYNEEASLPFLARTLESLRGDLVDYEPEFVLVDDCSTDTTPEVLDALFGLETDCRIVRHETNGGVARAILTGIERASHEIVCSIDCDCSYDPRDLVEMIPRLTDDVDLVTASPYHPDGGVRNVPGWRLFLSWSLSWMYARVLPVALHTYTACFRVHRRSAFVGTPLRNGGFLGMAEMLAGASRRGCRIVEHPSVLSIRLFGESKMKTLRTIRQHLGLLARLAFSPSSNTSDSDAEGSAPRARTIDAERSPAGRG